MRICFTHVLALVFPVVAEVESSPCGGSDLDPSVVAVLPPSTPSSDDVALDSDQEAELAEYVISETPIGDARRTFEQDRLNQAATFAGTTRDDFERRPNSRAGDILKRLPGAA